MIRPHLHPGQGLVRGTDGRSLSSSGAPSGPPDPVEFSHNPQDRRVLEPATTPLQGVSPGPSTARVAMASGHELRPGEGGYVFPPDRPEHAAAVTVASVVKTLELFEEACGQKIPWAFPAEQIQIVPDGGEMINAYYSREDRSLNFFHAPDPAGGPTLYTGASGEVVAHEAGHAILDGLRPGYLAAWSPDAGAFHESFGDILAMLVTLQDDRVVARLVEQTGGDLSRPNLVAALGEELGVVINRTEGKDVTGGDFTRNAIHSLTWADPSTLPERGGPDELGREVHSFSRLWTGAFYDGLKGRVDQNMSQGQPPAEAIRGAAREHLALYGHLMKLAPQGDFTFRQMAEVVLETDRQFMEGRNQTMWREIFTARKILPATEEAGLMGVEPRAGSEEPLRTVTVTLRGDDFGMFSGAQVETPVDGSFPLGKDAEARARLQSTLKTLIAEGRILYTEPHQKIETEDLFDPQGRPYLGVVRWRDGGMVIERVPIAT